MRQALDAANVEYYETPDSKWGFGSPGLWVHDASQEARAREVLEAAQAEWVAAHGESASSDGHAAGSRLSIRYWFYVMLAAAILALSLALPWWAFS